MMNGSMEDFGEKLHMYIEELYAGLKNPNRTVRQDEQDGTLIAHIFKAAGVEISKR